jgi:threonyl-tRNA synthetase
MLVVGDKEQSAGTVAVRERTAGDQGALRVSELIARLTTEVAERRLPR